MSTRVLRDRHGLTQRTEPARDNRRSKNRFLKSVCRFSPTFRVCPVDAGGSATYDVQTIAHSLSPQDALMFIRLSCLHASHAFNFCMSALFFVAWSISLSWCMSQATATDASQVAMVPAFERFARHNQVESVTAGRVLLSELSCTACHASSTKELEPKSGPKLESAGRRLRPAWIAAYLNAPHQLKPGTTMPDVLAGLDANKKSRAVAALTAFLASQQAAFPELKASGANPVPTSFGTRAAQ